MANTRRWQLTGLKPVHAPQLFDVWARPLLDDLDFRDGVCRALDALTLFRSSSSCCRRRASNFSSSASSRMGVRTRPFIEFAANERPRFPIPMIVSPSSNSSPQASLRPPFSDEQISAFCWLGGDGETFADALFEPFPAVLCFCFGRSLSAGSSGSGPGGRSSWASNSSASAKGCTSSCSNFASPFTLRRSHKLFFFFATRFFADRKPRPSSTSRMGMDTASRAGGLRPR
mmetsp:Transcript_42505/g.90788  ORF Transcript_42505/g.90788 Transcript_42505/m.90788 type:complete len:230 (+) Transcript_42505:201-890(+)